jgi:hypothetical protein
MESSYHTPPVFHTLQLYPVMYIGQSRLSPPLPRRDLPLLRLLDNHRRPAPITHKTTRVRRRRRRHTRHRVIANVVIGSKDDTNLTAAAAAAARGAMSRSGLRSIDNHSPSSTMPTPRNLNQRNRTRTIRPAPFPTPTPIPTTPTSIAVAASSRVHAAAAPAILTYHAALEHREELLQAGERAGHYCEVGCEGCCYCY